MDEDKKSKQFRNFCDFDKTFLNNQIKSREIFKDKINQYAQQFDALQEMQIKIKNKNEKQGIVISLMNKAVKMSYITLSLVLQGSVSESYIVSRNLLELRVVILDIFVNEETLHLFHKAHRSKRNLKKDDDLKQMIINDWGEDDLSKMSFKNSLRRIKKSECPYIKEVVIQASKWHPLLSDFVSHENIYNLVRETEFERLVNGQMKLNVYVGQIVSNTESLLLQVDRCIEDIVELKNDMHYILNN